MVDNSMISEEELFQVVGPGWKTYEVQKRKITLSEKLNGSPDISLNLLLRVV